MIKGRNIAYGMLPLEAPFLGILMRFKAFLTYWVGLQKFLPPAGNPVVA